MVKQVAATLSELMSNGCISPEFAEDTLSSLLRKALSKQGTSFSFSLE